MDNKRFVHIVAISGSLRRGSSNSALVNASARLAPDGVEMSVFDGLADLPPFNPDLDEEGTPDAVAGFRATLQACDAILLSSPEVSAANRWMRCGIADRLSGGVVATR